MKLVGRAEGITQFVLRLSESDKALLVQLAREDCRSLTGEVRYLIQAAAAARAREGQKRGRTVVRFP